jgi:hypothetical protein
MVTDRGRSMPGLQLRITEGDEDHEIAQTLAATVPNAELFVYPGAGLRRSVAMSASSEADPASASNR